MAKVFISYRRSDSATAAGRIYDRLVLRLGKKSVFKDVDNIPLGVNFGRYIEDTLRQCAAVLVVIGPDWLDARAPDGSRRLDDPHDWVRIEIESALALGLAVTPLLVNGAALPKAEHLPASLRALTQQNGLAVREDPDFSRDMDRVVASIERLPSSGGFLGRFGRHAAPTLAPSATPSAGPTTTPSATSQPGTPGTSAAHTHPAPSLTTAKPAPAALPAPVSSAHPPRTTHAPGTTGRTRKRTLRGAMMVVLLTSLVAASFAILTRNGGNGSGRSVNSGPAAAPDAQQVLKLGYLLPAGTTATPGLDPAYASNDASIAMAGLIFPTLLTWHYSNGTLALIPWAAEKYTVGTQAGAELLTFTIRSGLKWSDGTPITAESFRDGLLHLLDPCVQSPWSADLYLVHSAEGYNNSGCPVSPSAPLPQVIAVDATTLNVQFASHYPTYAYAPALFAGVVGMAVPSQLLDVYGTKNWTSHLTDKGGFGGNLFKLTTWNHTTGQMTFARDTSFGGPGAPAKLREIDVTFYTDPEKALQDMQNKVISAETGVLTPDVALAANGAPYQTAPYLANVFLQPNWAKAPFDNEYVRQAFALAIDRDAIAQAYEGTVLPTNHIVPQGEYGYDASLNGPDGTSATSGNATLAQQLIAQYAQEACGGVVARCPPVALTFATNAPGVGQLAASQAAAVLVNDWHSVLGYPVSLRGVPAATFMDEISSSSQAPALWLQSWVGDYPDPQDWLSAQFLPESPLMLNHADVPPDEALLRAADSDGNAADRATKYNQAEQGLITSVARIPLFQLQVQWLAESKVETFANNPTGVWLPENIQATYIAA